MWPWMSAWAAQLSGSMSPCASTGESHRQLWIPRGFAHGFAVLSDEATILYKCDAPYDRGSEIGIRWNDPDIGIDWGVEQPILSEKDAAAPLLRDLTAKLPQYQG